MKREIFAMLIISATLWYAVFATFNAIHTHENLPVKESVCRNEFGHLKPQEFCDVK